MHESRLHQHIYARSVGLRLGASRLIVAPGDDCAVIGTPSGDLQLLTVDQLVEGRHFEPGTDIDLVARKAIARSVSDIAAMGGQPDWAMAAAVLPQGDAQADALFDAMSRWARHWACPLIGGDIASHASSEHPLTLTVTVGGTMLDAHAPVLRSGAKPGDRLYLTGPVGGSFASGRHLTFEPRLEAGQWAASVSAHAMIDLSDGLGRDSDRVARASGVVIELDAAKLPINSDCPDWKQAAGEGEDHELLIALAPDQPVTDAPMPLLGPIGTARACQPQEQPRAMITDPRGTRHEAQSLGWDH